MRRTTLSRLWPRISVRCWLKAVQLGRLVRRGAEGGRDLPELLLLPLPELLPVLLLPEPLLGEVGGEV